MADPGARKDGRNNSDRVMCFIYIIYAGGRTPDMFYHDRKRGRESTSEKISLSYFLYNSCTCPSVRLAREQTFKTIIKRNLNY